MGARLFRGIGKEFVMAGIGYLDTGPAVAVGNIVLVCSVGKAFIFLMGAFLLYTRFMEGVNSGDTFN